MKNYLTIDIGGTDIKYGVINDTENLLFTSSIPTETIKGSKFVIHKIIDLYEDLNKKYNLHGLAISSTGVIDDKTNSLIAPPTMPGWDTINFKRDLKSLNTLISVENDVNCMALCEQHLIENNKRIPCLFAMTIGTGIGGSIFINGKIHKGSLFSAGEIGKTLISNDKTSFENIASTSALVKQSKKIYPDISTGIDVFTLYDKNDAKIVELVNKFYYNLARGIINIIYILNPNIIIIGGGITNRGNTFLDELKIHINNLIDPYYLGKFEIKLAKNKNNAGLIGAFINFKNLYL